MNGNDSVVTTTPYKSKFSSEQKHFSLSEWLVQKQLKLAPCPYPQLVYVTTRVRRTDLTANPRPNMKAM